MKFFILLRQFENVQKRLSVHVLLDAVREIERAGVCFQRCGERLGTPSAECGASLKELARTSEIEAAHAHGKRIAFLIKVQARGGVAAMVGLASLLAASALVEPACSLERLDTPIALEVQTGELR